MLKQMREGSKSTVLKVILFGLLLLAMAGLALMDVQGMFRGGVGNSTVASFGGQKLTSIAFDQMVQNALRENQLKQNDAYRDGVPQQVLKQEIESRLVSMAADDLGIRVDDAQVAKQVKELLSPLVEKGMTEKEALQRMLQSYGVSERQMVATLKAQMASQRLLNTVVTGAHAPQQLVSDVLKFRNEWRRGEYFRLGTENAGAVPPPPEPELAAYYNTIAREYALPEYRTLSVIVLDKKTLGGEAKISEDALKQAYDANIADYTTPETRVISQVIAQDEAKAKEIHAAAEASKDLQAAGKDKGSYIKSAPFTEAAMPAELSKTAFSAEAGKVLPPIKSPLGWHVLYVEKVTPPAVKPFEAVKADIEKELSQDKVSEALYEHANKLDDEIAGGKTLAEVAKENNIAEIILDKVDSHGIDPTGKKPAATVPLLSKVVETGFSLQKGAASQLIETPEGSFVIVAVNDIFPAQDQPFEKVRDEVIERWMAEHKSKAINDTAAKILERVKKGESLDNIAGEFGKRVQPTSLVQRGTDPNKTGMEPDAMTALFTLGKVGELTSVNSDNSVIILRLAERKTQAPGEISKEDADKLTKLLNRSLQSDLLDQFRASLLAEYKVKINEKLLGEMYKPKAEDESGAEE